MCQVQYFLFFFLFRMSPGSIKSVPAMLISGHHNLDSVENFSFCPYPHIEFVRRIRAWRVPAHSHVVCNSNYLRQYIADAKCISANILYFFPPFLMRLVAIKSVPEVLNIWPTFHICPNSHIETDLSDRIYVCIRVKKTHT